jgi:tetratricopeptide (TPR) repeat protein
MSRDRIILATFIIPVFLVAANIDEAIRLFNAFQFEQSRELFHEVVQDRTDPRIAEAYYYLGRLSVAPDSALHFYRLVASDFPESRYADIAHLEIAKIHIARHNYASAILTLNGLLDKYPDTNVKDEVLFWLGVSYMSNDQEEQGASVIKNLRATYPKSIWSERAANVLPGTPEQTKRAYYTVQVGSYRNRDNAQRHAAEMREHGFDTEVVEALVKGTTYFRVWVGTFPTMEQARTFSLKLDSLGIKGNVVKGY